jgi:Peptidase family M23
MYKPFIFPTLEDKSWGYFNMGELARQDFPDVEKPNPLLNYAFTAEWKKSIAKNLKTEHIWGGYLEDRTHLWRGLYDNPEAIIHLGVDYNVPAGTPTITPVNATIVHVFADDSLVNGWGGRIIMASRDVPFLIYGHLIHDTLPVVGQEFRAGEVVGYIAGPEENGGWVPHLHVQCVSIDWLDQYMDDLTLIDGYVLTKLSHEFLMEIAPDPTLLVGKLYE